MSYKKSLYLLIGFFFFSGVVLSQTRISSPYSRYGIGDAQIYKFTPNLGMGGISLAFRTNTLINYSNPASYCGFDSLSFVFSGGIAGQRTILETSEIEQKSNYASLGYLLFGFPVTKWLSTSIGLVPYSNVGYKITVSEDAGVPIGTLNYIYEGSGGINQFYIGSGIKLHENLSIGVNAMYLFGGLSKFRMVYFDSANFFNYRNKNTINVGDFAFNFGLNFKKQLNDKIDLFTGLIYGPSTKVSAKITDLSETFTSAGSFVYVKDTVEYKDDEKGNIQLPQNFGAGILFSKQYHWKAGMDFQWQEWKNYSSFGTLDSLKNSFQIALGGEIIPKYKSLTGYFNKVRYRAGFRYAQSYLQLRDTRLTEYGISFGVGLPIRRSKSMVNIGFEYGKRGTTDKNLISETFGRVCLGLNVYENWFIRRKFE